ncbi:MAG: hypothetical protein JW798_17250 [Prolixibacteraceae bacterium]|nr:hypothetical protein [Prolixibacteraceae bacterium]
MNKAAFTGELKQMIDMASRGTPADVDEIMKRLSPEASLPMTRYVDFALSLIDTSEGFERIRYYLFNGTLIQRNYASLYFSRTGEWSPVKEAYEKGLIDEIQAFAR